MPVEITKLAADKIRGLKRYRAYLVPAARGFAVKLVHGIRSRPNRALHVTRTAAAAMRRKIVRVGVVDGKLVARILPPRPAPLTGKIVDVSNNNGTVDFGAVKRAGAVGVWLKVSEGTTFVDQTYLRNRAAAKKAGLLVGGYHFCRPGASSAAAQVDFFTKHLILEPGDLLPALDFEAGDGLSNTALLAWIDAGLRAMKARIGQQPVLYAGQYFVSGLPLHAPRWIPTYGRAPVVAGWAAWQFTDGQAEYPGSICKLDTSVVPDLHAVTYRGPVREAH